MLSQKLTAERRREQHRKLRRLLERQLDKAETKIILQVCDAEQHGEQFHAGPLGLANALADRGWLCRGPGRTFHLSVVTRALFAEHGGGL